MPVAKKRAMKKKTNRPRRKGVMGKRKNNVFEFASCSVTRTLAPARMNAPFTFDTFQLADFPRAVGIAQNYQHFRITGIKVTWKPAYDTTFVGMATPLQKPNLYAMIDKAGSIPQNFVLEGLKAAGARPRALDERPLHTSWRPSVLGEDLNVANAASAARYAVSPWLSTNANATNPGAWVPSTVAHHGLKWYVEEASGSATAIQMEVEVQFQFKKPSFPTYADSSVTIGSLQYAVPDQSPDGVEGGTDGITIPILNQ